MGGKPGKLSPKQRAFVREYLLCRNATEAARKAGYSEKTANEQAARLLANVSIARLVEAGEKKAVEKFELKQEQIIEALAAIAFFNPLDVMEWSKKYGVVWKDSKKLERRQTAALDIWGSPSRKGGSVSLRNVDRNKALELLGKHTGLWRDKDDGSGEAASTRNREDVLRRVSELVRRRKRRGEPPDPSET